MFFTATLELSNQVYQSSVFSHAMLGVFSVKNPFVHTSIHTYSLTLLIHTTGVVCVISTYYWLSVFE